MLVRENSSLVPPPPYFHEVPAELLTSRMQAASNLAASAHYPLAPAGVGQKRIFPPPVQLLAPLAAAGAGQKTPSPSQKSAIFEPGQPQAPNLNTAALEITPFTRAGQIGSAGVGNR